MKLTTKQRNRNYYAPGPKPRTERGKRRHEHRSDDQKQHAKRVWAGGYIISTR